MSGMTNAKPHFNLQVSVVAGDTATTNIPVTGILLTDEIIAVARHIGAGTDVTDVTDITSEASITSDGNIQLDTTNTSADKLQVFWVDTSI